MLCHRGITLIIVDIVAHRGVWSCHSNPNSLEDVCVYHSHFSFIWQSYINVWTCIQNQHDVEGVCNTSWGRSPPRFDQFSFTTFLHIKVANILEKKLCFFYVLAHQSSQWSWMIDMFFCNVLAHQNVLRTTTSPFVTTNRCF